MERGQCSVVKRLATLELSVADTQKQLHLVEHAMAMLKKDHRSIAEKQQGLMQEVCELNEIIHGPSPLRADPGTPLDSPKRYEPKLRSWQTGLSAPLGTTDSAFAAEWGGNPLVEPSYAAPKPFSAAPDLDAALDAKDSRWHNHQRSSPLLAPQSAPRQRRPAADPSVIGCAGPVFANSSSSSSSTGAFTGASMRRGSSYGYLYLPISLQHCPKVRRSVSAFLSSDSVRSLRVASRLFTDIFQKPRWGGLLQESPLTGLLPPGEHQKLLQQLEQLQQLQHLQQLQRSPQRSPSAQQPPPQQQQSQPPQRWPQRSASKRQPQPQPPSRPSPPQQACQAHMKPPAPKIDREPAPAAPREAPCQPTLPGRPQPPPDAAAPCPWPPSWSPAGHPLPALFAQGQPGHEGKLYGIKSSPRRDGTESLQRLLGGCADAAGGALGCPDAAAGSQGLRAGMRTCVDSACRSQCGGDDSAGFQTLLSEPWAVPALAESLGAAAARALGAVSHAGHQGLRAAPTLLWPEDRLE